MKWIERFDLFLLDFDGLLVDTERLHFKAYQILCKRHGEPLHWDFTEYVRVAHTSGDGLKRVLVLHLGIEEGEWPALYEEKKKIYLELLGSGDLGLVEGVEEFLKELESSHKKRCVVTHSPREQVDRLRSRFPILDSIPVWITREDYEAAKPAPDGYNKAIEVLADPGDRIVGLEDSLKGIRALKKTSALPILICPSSHPQLSDPELAGVDHFPSLGKVRINR